MSVSKVLLLFAILFVSCSLGAQTTFIPKGDKAYDLLSRLEIKQGKNTDLNFSTVKPFSRERVIPSIEYLDSLMAYDDYGLTKVDRYNLHALLMNNSEWVQGDISSFESERPIWGTFYKTKPNLLEVNTKDFFLAVNPVLNLRIGKESGNDETLFLNKRGVKLRGRIAHKIGFAATITDNQERGPSFFQEYVSDHRAVPGAGFYKRFKQTGQDYFEASGYFTVGATKYIDIQFGYDNNFIGNGYRSLFLSDFGSNYLFLKLNTRIWKLNYQNLFMELMPQYVKHGDVLLDRKYAAMHHLSMNVTKWLNIGLFEGVVFGRKNHFDFQYLNPIIFLRHVEGTVGSPDNAVAGIDFKANAMKRFQFYGQLLLDEFLLKEVGSNSGYWANKYGYQLGVKYVDAFGLPNLDLQFEANRVRPFTYSHYDSTANYTHYNQPLAHPLGANFQEFIGLLHYQPAPKWRLDGRAIYYYKGLDTLSENFGGNIFKLYTTRSRNYGYDVGDGRKIKVFNLSTTLSYEWRENLFLEGNILFRKESNIDPATVFFIGIRWNAPRRDYAY